MLLKILYQDEFIVAVDKPSGLLVHRSMLDKHETQFALQLVRDQIGQHVFPVHRLDRPTSGVLLFALTPDMARALGEQFSANAIEKYYLTIVRGHAPASGLIDYALKEQLDKIADKLANQDKAAQSAQTSYQRVANFELEYAVGRYQTARYSLLLVSPKTGRKHQIRRHLAHINHPIVGDTTHGDGKHNIFLRNEFAYSGLALSCIGMTIHHPVSHTRLTLRADPSDSMVGLLSQWQLTPTQLHQLIEQNLYKESAQNE
ncbi:MAG: tRNA pseudouridine(65) synthase TruC [Paraglaciecola sp.]|nr:tRNA pseudouridine(65) synthase TruC [Paraglaciecola sp.]NCT49032.1 tRNA pseudouridine(65) synthase TruC [Paraglaciecola sp.]